MQATFVMGAHIGAIAAAVKENRHAENRHAMYWLRADAAPFRT
jgi:hypothetical protein